ncbi:MAG: amidohydrolase [Acidobacteriota bacterium]|nr:MAG: amidohydrolase [Acidobacteriota bacterium]
MKSSVCRLLVSVFVFLLSLSLGFGQKEPSPADTFLLKDYRPQSIYKIPITRVEKAKYPVIDVHSHTYAKTLEAIDRWVQVMDEVGVEKTIILSGATGEEFDKIYDDHAGRYPDRFQIWCGFDFEGADEPGWSDKAVKELVRCYNKGARGVGEIGDKGKGFIFGGPKPAPGLHANDPRMDPLFEKCAELGIPVNIHVADPYWMYQPMDAHNDGLMNAAEWRLDNQEGILSHEEMLLTLEGACSRHPKTTFIACHFANCSHDLARLGTMFDKYPNLNADISARYAETSPIPRYVKKFIEKYQDRLLYGTDMGVNPEMYRITFRVLETADEHFYEQELFGYHWSMNGFDLEPSLLEKIYRTNALRLLSKE